MCSPVESLRVLSGKIVVALEEFGEAGSDLRVLVWSCLICGTL